MLISQGKEFIADLSMRGERILLPEVVTRLTGFSDRNEYVIAAVKGKLEIRELNIARK